MDQPAAAKKRRKNRTTEEIKDEYRSIYASALNIYDKHDGDLSKIKVDYAAPSCLLLLAIISQKVQKQRK